VWQKNGLGCPASSTLCTCACSGYRSCQHQNQDECLAPTADGTCPADSVQCEHEGVPPVTPRARDCICGGGHPCQRNDNGSSDDQCVAMQYASDGSLHCPAETTKCACECGKDDNSHPCSYTSPSGEAFCFPLQLNSTLACPASTTHCTATPDVPAEQLSTTLDTVGPTPAPTPLADYHEHDDSIVSPAASFTGDGKRNCLFSGWTTYSPCSRKCGGGVQTRSPKVTQLPEQGGIPCPQDQVRTCNTDLCNNVDCAAHWGPWKSCSTSATRDGNDVQCGGGVQYQHPIITRHQSGYGAACPATRSRPCNTGSCYELQPKCDCDPFRATDYTDGDTQDGANNPNSPIYKLSSGRLHVDRNPDDITCTFNTTTSPGSSPRMKIQVHHPASQRTDGKGLSVLAGDKWETNTGNAGGKHKCKYDKTTKQCRCCTCHQLQCHATPWTSWSACGIAQGETTATESRQHQVEGMTTFGSDCATVTERRACVPI
jgi:hypothetical protein